MAIKSRNSTQYIIIIPADKGNTTVVLEFDDYNRTIQERLDPSTFQKLNKPPPPKPNFEIPTN